jgi:hypothetical protein
MATITQVSALADAYRRAMAQGDEEFAGAALERKVLHALVASSAADASRWVQTRVPNGTQVAEPLTALVPALQEGDVVGKTLDAIKNQLISQAKSIASSVFLGSSWPLWVGAVVGAIAGLIAMSFDAGVSLGSAFVALLAGGGPVGYAVTRTLHASGPAAQAIGGAAGSLLGAASSVGTRAERVFRDATGPTLAAVYGGNGTLLPGVAAQARGVARTIVLASYALAIVAGIVFVVGVAQGFSAAFEEKRCEYSQYDPTCPGQSPFGNN